MTSTLGFIIALKAERSSLTSPGIWSQTPRRLPSGHWVTVSGVGAWNARKAAQHLVGKGVSGLVSWGSAAALDASLQTGHLLLPDRVVGATGDIYLVQADWQERLAANLAAHLDVSRGSLTESLSVVASVADKQALRKTSQSIAVDMESAAVGAVAKAAHLPFVVIRAVADTAAMTLPRSVHHAVDSSGTLSIPRLLAYAALHPSEWAELKTLGSAFDAAHKTLRTVTERVGHQHFLFLKPVS